MALLDLPCLLMLWLLLKPLMLPLIGVYELFFLLKLPVLSLLLCYWANIFCWASFIMLC